MMASEGLRPEFTEDDGGPVVIAVEAAPQDCSRQALWVRVGPVWDGNEERPEPGVWIEYQADYMREPLTGPVLLSPATWRHLTEAVLERLRERGV